jgi:hypothetical protein
MSDQSDETDVDLHAIPCPRELPVEITAELAKVRAEFAVPREEFAAEMAAEMAQTRAKVNAQWAALYADLRVARAELVRLRELNAAEAARLDPSLPLQ